LYDIEVTKIRVNIKGLGTSFL